jgi:hypothetical protein
MPPATWAMPTPGADRAAPTVQRLCSECEEELQRQVADDEEERLLQAKAAGGDGPLPTPEVGSGIDAALAGSGQPLPVPVRAYFEPRFGHDFTQIRIHQGAAALESARMLNAKAFTCGRHIVFGEGQYAPETSTGRKLLAHELTHVVQQRRGGPAVQRKIQFTDPTPARQNPIRRVLSEPTLGYTRPTVNGKALPDLQSARSLLFDALQPKESSFDPTTKECSFTDFDVTISADVVSITQPTSNQWTMNLPGADIKGIPACHSQSSVPVVMTGKPDGQTIVKLVDQYEQEHVDDLKGLYAKHLEAHFTWLMALREQDDDAGKCRDKLTATLGNKDAAAVQTFATEWLAAVAARDAEGGHTFKNKVRGPANCASLTIETSK